MYIPASIKVIYKKSTLVFYTSNAADFLYIGFCVFTSPVLKKYIC